MQSKSNIVLLIGRPGSGKGTQAKLLGEKLGWLVLSSGDRFKGFRDGTGPLSARVREAYDKGEFMPDWFADYLLESGILELDPAQGVVMEGFARTRTQAEHLVEIMGWLHRTLTVVHLEVSEDRAKARMLERAQTMHRPDSDDALKIDIRFEEYRRNTEPSLDYLREQGLVTDVNGEQSPDAIAEQILGIIEG